MCKCTSICSKSDYNFNNFQEIVEITSPTINITRDNLNSSEVKPYMEYYNIK